MACHIPIGNSYFHLVLKFKSYQPSKELSMYVHSIWTLESQSSIHEDDSHFRFIPDGNVEWMFHIKTPNAFRFKGENTYNSSKTHCLSQFRAYLDVQYSAESSELFAIKFHPWAAYVFFDGPMKEYVEGVIDLQETQNKGMQAFIDNIHTANSNQERIDIAEKYLRSKLHNHDPSDVSWLSHQIKSLSNPEVSPVGDLKTHLSKRRLQQIFSSRVGISSKKVERIYRIRNAAEYITRNPDASFTDVTYLFNFYDQSHFIQELTHFSGLTPTQFQLHLQHDDDHSNLRLMI